MREIAAEVMYLFTGRVSGLWLFLYDCVSLCSFYLKFHREAWLIKLWGCMKAITLVCLPHDYFSSVIWHWWSAYGVVSHPVEWLQQGESAWLSETNSRLLHAGVAKCWRYNDRKSFVLKLKQLFWSLYTGQHVMWINISRIIDNLFFHFIIKQRL